jgi:hypothetical protein
MNRVPTMLVLLALVLAGAGCVRRVIDITSDPPGARVWVNDREAGRTPCSVEFTHYGRYDVRLRREGFEPVAGWGDADEPVWDFVGCDLVSEVVPARLTSRVQWHFTLIPTDKDEAALVRRARAMRTGLDDRAAEVAQERGEPPVIEREDPAAVPVPGTVIPQAMPGSDG